LHQSFNDIIFDVPIVIFIIKFINFTQSLCRNSPEKPPLRGARGVNSACLSAGRLVERPEKSGPRLMSWVLKIVEGNR
jgi:hypothetical protein